MKTCREVNKAMKEALRKAGINTKFISIRHKWCGYSEAYHVEIKDEKIDRNLVDAVLNNFEEIDRDERTGEILEGGNTYIFVQYCWDIRKKLYEYEEVAA